MGGGGKNPYSEFKNCEYDLTLSNGFFHIKCDKTEFEVPCKAVQIDLFTKAKYLCDQIIFFSSMEEDSDHELTCRSRDGREADTESSDEDIPDPPIIPPFCEADLTAVKMLYKEFFNAYRRALVIGVYSCVGKDFVDAAWKYADLCTRLVVTDTSRFLSKYSTAKGAPQPGACFIKWSLPREMLKSSYTSGRVILSRERYADHVTYDKLSIINVSVTELKENEESPIESQNNEQMIGLWRSSQQVMLGMEVRGKYVKPKILLLTNERLNMLYLKQMNIEKNSDLVNIVTLMIAFLICVDYSCTHN